MHCEKKKGKMMGHDVNLIENISKRSEAPLREVLKRHFSEGRVCVRVCVCLCGSLEFNLQWQIQVH